MTQHAGSPHGFQDHPYRRAIMDEVHARPVELVPEVCRIRRLIFVVPARPGIMQSVFDRFCQRHGEQAGSDGTIRRQCSLPAGRKHVTWEFHSEFITVTWRSDLTDLIDWPEDIGLEIIGDAELLGATRVDVIAAETIPERLLPGFNLPSLCLSDIESGKAQVATDFVTDGNGFTRLELAAGRLTSLHRAIIVRRLLEVETYRSMTLLGLPLARDATGCLRDLEINLTSAMGALSGASSVPSVTASLAALHDLSIRAGQLSEQLDYRFAASTAYGEILHARLAALRETPAGLGSSLSSYIGNRVEPALATCSAMNRRLSILSDKIERAIGLLDVRIGVDIQVQSASVLDTIAKTGQSQFQLQRTVEGLSTIAISYYLLGIVSYLLAGPLETWHWPKSMTISLLAPFVVMVVWLFARSVRSAHTRS